MAIKPRINKDIYGAALSGDGYSSITKRKSGTSGTYANGIEALAQLNGNGLSGVGAKAPLLKTPDMSSRYNGSIAKPIYNSRIELGGGATGGTTREGVITGGLGVTKMPTINPIKSTGITKTASTQAKYGDILAAMKQSSVKNIAANSALAPQQTQAAAPAPTETAAKTESAKETPATYEEYLEQQRELLNQRKAEADRQAEAAKERAAVDAQASYAQNMATYGTNAENMAQMGLQGGGYSDYLNAQAYAQKRADVQQANVTEQAAKAQNTATYEDALSEINKSDIEYQEKQREKAAALKQSALDAINQGSLNESNIGSYLDSLKGLGATDNDVADIKETYQKNSYNEYLAQITSGGEQFSTKAVDDAYNAGNLSKEHYESLKKAWNDDIDPNILLNSTDNHETVKKAYEEYINNSWCTAEKKAALKKAFDGYEAKHYKSDVSTGYNAHSSTVTLNTPDGKVTVTYGVNSKTLKKSSGNAVFNTDIYKNAGSGQVFIVNGRPYVKLDNGDLGWVNDYLGRGALEQLRDTYDGTVYDIS